MPISFLEEFPERFILSTMDMLAVALTNHKHVWTTEEKMYYESCVYILKNRIRQDDKKNDCYEE